MNVVATLTHEQARLAYVALRAIPYNDRTVDQDLALDRAAVALSLASKRASFTHEGESFVTE